MAKRGNALLSTISTQDQWNKCLNKPGLNLFDVYSECWGPCLAIQPTFKQLQMEFGDDLQITLVETDKIEDLTQFRGTSQPLFLLYSQSVPIALLRGANQPKLLDIVRHYSKERKENKKPLNIFEEPTAEEEALASRMSSSSVSQSSASQLTDFTLALIKPDAVRAGYIEDIICDLNDKGVMVISKLEHIMTAEEVHKFYSHLEQETYFLDLVEYMTSGPSVALVLAKANPEDRPVCEILKELRGPKDIACAKQEHPDSLRAKFASDTSVMENAVHTSDNSEAAAKELAFFFPNFHSETAALERTLCIIRPDSNKQYKEKILSQLKELGFMVALQREFIMSKEMAQAFYAKQKSEPFFDALVTQMTSGPSLVLALCSKDAVKTWRGYLGPTTDAKEKAPDSMRAQFTTDETINGLHGSSSAEEAVEELNFFFPAEQTVAVIKPEMMSKKEEIMQQIQEAGIVVQAQKTVKLTRDEAGNFYEEHKNKAFYGDLCNYMASGESSFLVLSANNAVEKWREIIGPTDPNVAKENKPASLRSKLGTDIMKNGVHGSSSVEHALKSIEQIFGESLTIRSMKNRSLSNSSLSLKQNNTSAGIAEIGSDGGGGTEGTENDVTVSLPTDTPHEESNGNRTESQHTLVADDQELTELPHDNQNEESPPQNEESPSQNDESQSQSKESLPQKEESMSQNDESPSQKEESLSQNEGSSPQKEYSQPQNEDSEPQNEDLQSKNEDSQLKTEELQLPDEESKPVNEESIAQDREATPRNDESHSQNNESQSQHNESQSQNKESHIKIEESQSKLEESQSQNNESLAQIDESNPQPDKSPSENNDIVNEGRSQEQKDSPSTVEPAEVEAAPDEGIVIETILETNPEENIEEPAGENTQEVTEGEETRGGAPEGVQSSPTNEDLLPPADGLVVEQPNADPSMANMSETDGLSPISEGQEDYFQDSFNSDSSAIPEVEDVPEGGELVATTVEQNAEVEEAEVEEGEVVEEEVVEEEVVVNEAARSDDATIPEGGEQCSS